MNCETHESAEWNFVLRQRQSDDASLAKKTLVDSDTHKYSTMQNKAEQ